MSQGVKVRGSCKAGHITETTAARGRVTWNGPCAREGCGLPVFARRVKTTDAPAGGDDPPGSPPAGTTDREQFPFVRLDGYDELPDHAPATGIAVEPEQRDDDHTGGDDGSAAAGSDPAGGQQLPDPVGDNDARPGWRSRLAGPDRHSAYQHPLV